MSRRLHAAALTLALLAGVAHAQRPAKAAAPETTPIIFVHGNGDDASRWIPVIWLFESNGYPADRLFAIRFHNPVARTDDTREEPDRSSTEQAKAELGRFVHDVLTKTHAHKVVLVGSSRGGLTIRNYIQNGEGKQLVQADVLCGTPNHGVNATVTNPNGEFNGKGTFLTALNRPAADGSETVADVRTLTLRSDSLDKYAQPMGIAFGRPDQPTGVTYEGPALKGAENVVLPRKDHREVAFSNEAFAAMYRFIVGRAPQTLAIQPMQKPVLSGLVTGFAGTAPTNDPLAGVHLRVSEVPVQGSGPLVYETTTDATGAWGPVRTLPGREYAFDLESGGRHVVYFLPRLTRSTSMLNLRLLPVPTDAAGQSGLLVLRPDGYLSKERDPVSVGGQPASGEPGGLPNRDSFVTSAPSGAGTVEVVLHDESIRVLPSADLSRVLAIAEFLR